MNSFDTLSEANMVDQGIIPHTEMQDLEENYQEFLNNLDDLKRKIQHFITECQRPPQQTPPSVVENLDPITSEISSIIMDTNLQTDLTHTVIEQIQNVLNTFENAITTIKNDINARRESVDDLNTRAYLNIVSNALSYLEHNSEVLAIRNYLKSLPY